jgi:hypothetical protein
VGLFWGLLVKVIKLVTADPMKSALAVVPITHFIPLLFDSLLGVAVVDWLSGWALESLVEAAGGGGGSFVIFFTLNI